MTFLLIWPIWAEWGSFPHSILKWESNNDACQHCQWYNFLGRLISVIKDGHFCPIAFCSGVKIYLNKVSQLKLQNPWASFCASLTGKWKDFPLLNKECFAAKLLQFPWTIQGRRENPRQRFMHSFTSFNIPQARAPARCTWALAMEQGGCQGYHNLSKKLENKSKRATLPSIIPVKRVASHAALSCSRRKGKSLTGMQKGELCCS